MSSFQERCWAIVFATLNAFNSFLPSCSRKVLFFCFFFFSHGISALPSSDTRAIFMSLIFALFYSNFWRSKFFWFLRMFFFSLAGPRHYLIFSWDPCVNTSPVTSCRLCINITFLLGAAFICRAVWCLDLAHAAHRKIFWQPFLSYVVLNFFCMIGLFAYQHI